LISFLSSFSSNFVGVCCSNVIFELLYSVPMLINDGVFAADFIGDLG